MDIPSNVVTQIIKYSQNATSVTSRNISSYVQNPLEKACQLYTEPN